MNPNNQQDLHSWNVSVNEAIRIQETLREKIVLKNTSSGFRSIGGGDVGYAQDRNLLLGAVVVLSFPELELLDLSRVHGKIPFPYIPGLLSFREGPVLIEAMKKLKVKPDVMIYEGQGIAHPRGCGLASHLGLWFDLPSIGCTKTPLLRGLISPDISRESFEWIEREGEKVGAVLRTREGVKPVFVSPGHRIDLAASIQIVLAACRRFRIPEPLRMAHRMARFTKGKVQST
jgi:deoxyribonuclease V